MPLYTYQVVRDDGSLGEPFEVFRKMSDPPLTAHPETGEPVQRVFIAPNVAYTHTEAAVKSKTSDKNLDRLGFTKYQKEGDGVYRKTAGKGPAFIERGKKTTGL